ncbi:hypothetical protein ANCDUO_08884 [Ancylostoma duodenale]|uniref:Uncharacterized protein n=1 Tax=Ancylostoma duodenale TaxID=51022 RepID=A0A0C2DEN5_9BILA|nr:hypothetical protein ANCDUO_08884 [Ancylostoma duodenale]
MILAGVLLVLCSFEIGEIEAGIRYRRDCGYGCDRYGTTTIIKKIYLGRGGRRRGYRRRYRPPRVRQWYTPVAVPVPVPGPTVVVSAPPTQPLWMEYENFHKYGCENCAPPPCETGNCGGGYGPPPVPQGPPPGPPMPGPGCTTGTCGTGGGYPPPPVPAGPPPVPPMPGPGCTTGTCGTGYQPPPVPPPVPPPMPSPGCATGSCPPPMPGPGCTTGTCGGGYPPYGGVMAAKAPGAALVPNDVPEQAMQLNAKQNT